MTKLEEYRILAEALKNLKKFRKVHGKDLFEEVVKNLFDKYPRLTKFKVRSYSHYCDGDSHEYYPSTNYTEVEWDIDQKGLQAFTEYFVSGELPEDLEEMMDDVEKSLDEIDEDTWEVAWLDSEITFSREGITRTDYYE